VPSHRRRRSGRSPHLAIVPADSSARRKRRRRSRRAGSGVSGVSSSVAPLCEGFLHLAAGVSHVVEYKADPRFLAPTRSLSTPGPCEEERRSRSPERTAHESMSSESALRSASTLSRSCAAPAPLRSAISISRPLFAAEASIISEGVHSLRKSLTEALANGIFTASGAISSAGERCLHTAEVAGSNPASPTRESPANSRK
jgi:hypothetical protein